MQEMSILHEIEYMLCYHNDTYDNIIILRGSIQIVGQVRIVMAVAVVAAVGVQVPQRQK